jgi:predicted Zn-dependent protease
MTTVYKAKRAAVKLLAEDQPEDGQSPQELKFAINYLSFFGYIGLHLLKNLTVEDLRTAAKAFQRWFGLKPDGIVGAKTVRAMQEPRCGCPDILDKDKEEHAEYLQMQELVAEKKIKWSKTRLTYAIDGHLTGLSKALQAEMISAAFNSWTSLIDLEIHRCSIRKVKDADIVIGVGSGKTHRFDGRGGTLAWAYLPHNDKQLRMRFDLAETWVKAPFERGIHLQTVAAHEIGHLLGLKHSKAKGALMAPYYNPFVGKPQVKDDISRIQSLYGASGLPESLTSPPDRVVELNAGERMLVIGK